MRELKELSNSLNDTVEKLREDKDILKAVKSLQQIKNKLNKIIKENVTNNLFKIIFRIYAIY